MANILFDTKGVQQQVQDETGNRLTTWTQSLTNLPGGNTITTTDYTKPISQQLSGVDVLVITTRQFFQATGPGVQTNPIPAGTCMAYPSVDLYGIPQWVAGGGGLLLMMNHSGFQTANPPNNEPIWPVFDIALAASFGIQTAFATFQNSGGGTLTMSPATNAPAALTSGVTSVQAWDSGGIYLPPSSGPGNGLPLMSLPSSGCVDGSGLGYEPTSFVFSAVYPFGQGNVIILGHSGVAGNAGTLQPSPGQIDAGDNLQFLNNCVTYLAS